jgi:hypothetical protein
MLLEKGFNKQQPKHLQHLFNTWEEYREWSIHKSKQELLKAFPNDRENRNEEIKTD